MKYTAKELGLKGYSKLRKFELIKMIEDYKHNESKNKLRSFSKEFGARNRDFIKNNDRNRNSSSIMDEPVPEIKVPILKPIQFTAKGNVKSLKSLADSAAKPIIKNINKLADWLYSYVPEPVRNITNEKVNKLKNKINQIFKRLETEFKIEEKEMAMKGYLKSYRINGVSGYDPKKFISSIKSKVLDFIKQQKKPIKLKFLFMCTFQKENPATGQIDISTGYFHSLVETITESSDLSDILNTMTGIILEKVQQFQNEGSGWVFDNIESFDINIDPFEPLSGSSYISLPKNLEDKSRVELELELLADPDMLLMIEKGIRGRVSMISTRYGKANNPYMGDSYDPNQPTKYISYLDANNLYGWAMCKPLPTHGLEWMVQDELNNWKKLSDSEGTGCILEVDIEYPKELTILTIH